MSFDTPDNLKAARRITWIGLIANVILATTKFLAGFFGHSTVLITDAVHSLSDLATDVAVLVGSRYWGQPADAEHPYGHRKIETLVTLFIGIALALLSFELIQTAIFELYRMTVDDKPEPSPTWYALVAALLSIGVKELLFRKTAKVGVQIRSAAVVANAWHHRSDALSSIPAAIAVGACLALGNQYSFLDPVGTVVVGCMILYDAWKIMEPTFGTLLDASAPVEERNDIAELLHSVPEIKGFHRLRTRRIGPTGVAVSVHIQVDPAMSVERSHHLSHCVQDLLLSQGPDVVDVAIHVEPDTEPPTATVCLVDSK